MDLSVVVLSWNTAALTLRALGAVRAGAGGRSAEILCVDNGSRDGTVARVRQACPEVRLLPQARNLGYARGNNRALPHLRGRYTCFLNADAAPEPGALAHVLDFLDAHPAAGVAAPRLVGADGRRQVAARAEPTVAGLLHRHTAFGLLPWGRRAASRWRAGTDAQTPLRVDSVIGACIVIRTDLLHALGGFDEGYPFYWEDVDLCRRARERGAEVWLVPDGPPVHHEGGAATDVGGGPPRLAFLHGMVRYVALRDGPRRGAIFGLATALGILVHAALKVPELALRARRRERLGREAAARSTRASAASWARLLERDGGGLLRLLRPTAVPPLGRMLPQHPDGFGQSRLEDGVVAGAEG